MVYADLGRFCHTRGFNSSPAACSTEGRDRVSIHSGCHHRKLQVCGCLLATTSVSKD